MGHGTRSDDVVEISWHTIGQVPANDLSTSWLFGNRIM
jgi:hypothetical protein